MTIREKSFVYCDRDRVKRQNGAVTNVTSKHKVTPNIKSKRSPKMNVTKT